MLGVTLSLPNDKTNLATCQSVNKSVSQLINLYEWATSENTTILFVCAPEFCISIVSSFSWDLQWSQEKTKTMPNAKVGGTNKKYYGIFQKTLKTVQSWQSPSSGTLQELWVMCGLYREQRSFAIGGSQIFCICKIFFFWLSHHCSTTISSETIFSLSVNQSVCHSTCQLVNPSMPFFCNPLPLIFS